MALSDKILPGEYQKCKTYSYKHLTLPVVQY
jgi:hypothetical protein